VGRITRLECRMSLLDSESIEHICGEEWTSAPDRPHLLCGVQLCILQKNNHLHTLARGLFGRRL
jgi:hypothetical protein